MSLSHLRKLILPVILLLAAVLLRPWIISVYPVYGQLVDWLPYLSLGITLLLSAFFDRSRLFTASLGLLVIYYFIQSRLQASITEPQTLIIYTAITILIPLTLSVLLFYPERGLRNLRGVLLSAMIPLQVCIVLLILYLYPVPDTAAVISTHLPIKQANGYIMSIPASILHLLVFLAGTVKLISTEDEACAPLLAIILFSYPTFAFFDLAKISTLLYSAAGISLIVSQIGRSYDMAFRDELTGLPGRRALNDRLKGLGRQYVIAMVDVDHFKKFNDTYGHDTGDDVLKMVATKLGNTGGGGTAYRYGGEEFCIVFPGKTPDECNPFLESVRLSIEKNRMIIRNIKQRPGLTDQGLERRGRRKTGRNNQTVSVTISIGVACRNEKNTRADEVIKAADKALYKAKEHGRNCLQMAPGIS